ncbi:hypothetical protein [Streptomyces sp. NRRL B-1347]|uniref:hypothetical protein n=1 Tax=Streptomyces sp. NRRL B-1347 TaxID=1476877 RepID=UPI0004C5B2F7|nr:hypothetical protein [Streptomyces sp. NRRL B-1347]
MSQQQLGRSPVRPDPPPPPPDASRPGRFVGWLGGFGCAAAAYAVFQSLVGVLPETLSADAARYGIAAVSGVGTGVAAWLAAALLRARPEQGAAGPGPVAAPARAALAPAPGPFPALAAAAHTALRADLAVVDDPVRGLLTGWAHALDEQTRPVLPTPTGTAYGLHVLLELGVQDGRLSTSDLVDTLWRLRLPDGGWAARSQGSVPRPEVTALVLGALARAGADPARLADEAARCAARFTADLEPSGLARTHVVTTVLRGLLRAAPDAPAIARLRDSLVDHTITDPAREHRRCWGATLGLPAAHATRPSPVHTALAVVALDRAARVLGEDANTRAAREDGIRWLLACPTPDHDTCADLVNAQEEVRRPHPEVAWRQEVLFVRHFTAAWMVRALLTPGAWEVAAAEGREEAWRALVASAVTAVLRAERDGVWHWDGHDLGRPLWMTYQGLSALRAHAVWMYQPEG